MAHGGLVYSTITFASLQYAKEKRPACNGKAFVRDKEKSRRRRLGSQFSRVDQLRPEPILENVLLTCWPRKVRIRITTIAMRTKMRAYSTRPWPLFFNCSILARILICLRFDK